MADTTETQGFQPLTSSILSHCQAGSAKSQTSNLSEGLGIQRDDKNPMPEKQTDSTIYSQAQDFAGIGSWAESTPALAALDRELILD